MRSKKRQSSQNIKSIDLTVKLKSKSLPDVSFLFHLRLYLVAVLGDTARCLRGDVLGDGHGLHGLQRCRVRLGEAAAHALVDGTIPRENAVPSQRALLAAH